MVSPVSSFQGSRYQVIRKLGEGGKGIVFLCQDTALARRVAIKLIKEEVLDSEGLLRFQREVQAMASLVHPNVVTVFDIGQDAGKNYLVLELMEGGDVEHLIGASPSKRMDSAATIRIGQEVARALEHAHGHGILHRDIKPGNIWLTKTGQAKLGDFGLAYLGGGPKLTRAGMMVGSVAYMAPEVALGRQADARSDLYMLGASLYEMATGRVPFSGDDPVRVLFSHINDLPLPPRRFAPDIPDGLEALILRLLSKDPEHRPASASEVLRALEAVEIPLHPPLPKGEAPPTPPSQRGARGDLPPTPEPRFAQPLVGREREVALLRQRVDAALRGEGSLVFITGEAGIGKTRLASEVRPYARGRGFLWLEGHYPREGSTPFQPWVEAIRAFLRGASPSLLMKVLLPYGGELARLVPEVAERLGRVPAPPSIGPEEERLRLYEALAGFFTAIAREHPLVLFLDDLQWSSSIDALHHLARGAAPERLLLLATYRDIELEEKAALSETMQALNRERLFHALPLKRLGPGEVARLVTQTLGEAASAKLGELVYQKTEGNPYFVEEVVRYVTESGAITLGETGWDVKDTSLLQLPRSVKAVVGKRLEQFEEEARSILAWASVVGREFSLPLLEAITGVEEEKLLEAVDKAVAARVLTPRPTLGQEVYAFTDNQTRDVLYEGIGPARRRRYHLKVGQAIERVHARRLDEHHDALAHHFLEGNALEKALEYSLKAGDRAASIYAWERAIGHYQTALELLEEVEADPRQQAEVLERLGLVTLFDRGRGAVGYWEKALSIYENLGDQHKAGAVHLRLGHPALVGQLDREKAYSHCLEAVAVLEAEGEGPQLALAYAQLGYTAAHFREVAPAIPLMEKGLALADQLGDATGVIEAARLLGHVLVYHTGEVRRGLELLHRSCEGARKKGDLVRLSEAAMNLSREYATLRDSESALRWAEEGVEAGKQAGTLRGRVISAISLALARTLRGDSEGVLSGLEGAQQMARKGGLELLQVQGGSGPSLTAPGFVSFYLGDWDQVEADWLQALKYAIQAPATTHALLHCDQALGWLYLEKGDHAVAKTHLQAAATFAQARGDNPPELYTRALLVQACCKAGELEEAAEHLRRTREIFSLSTDWLGLAAEVHHAAGVVAAAQQRWPEAEAAFQQAVEINREYHLPYYEARSLLEWGEMYLSRSGGAASGDPKEADREKGMELLDQALAIFQRVQAKKMVAKVLARKELLKA